MFSECPKHCNAQRTLSKYSRNIACRLEKIKDLLPILNKSLNVNLNLT